MIMENNQTVSCMRKNVKWFLSSVAFACIVALLVIVLGGVFMNKSGTEGVISIYDEDAKYDVVFVGTSHVVSAMFPMEIWESHGITSCNYAQTGQGFGVTYHYACEAIETAKPKLVVCDLYYIYQSTRTAGGTSFKHQSLDNMRFFSLNRLKAIFETVPPGEWSNFLFPFFAFHSRWNDLTPRDFNSAAISSITKGSDQIFELATESYEKFVPIDPSETLQPEDYAIEYIDRLIALCERTNTQLLFTVIPYHAVGEEQSRDLEDDQRMYNWVSNYLAEKGVDCLNMLYCTKEMGFDTNQHMREWNHCNYWGGVIVSQYVADYIQQNYAIADHRGEAGYEQWDADMETYAAWRQKKLKAFNKSNSKEDK